MAEQGGNYLEIGRFEPSSKMCGCGAINKNLQLSDREWVCSECGTINQRDILAANNILKFALNPKNKSGQVLPDEPMEMLALVRSVK
jgi:putative transposase